MMDDGDERAAPFQAAVEAAAVRWPGLAIDAEVLMRHCEALHGAALGAMLERLEPIWLALALGCMQGDPIALGVFEVECVEPLRKQLRKLSPSRDLIDEVLQRTRIRLLVASDDHGPRIGRYAGRGPLPRWVRVTATRIILRILERSRDTGSDPEPQLAKLEDEAVQEVAVLDARHGDTYREALAAAFAELEPHLRSALHLAVRRRMSIDEIGRIHDVHRATAARWVQAARLGLLDGMIEHLKRRGLTTRTAVSLGRLLWSRQRLSLPDLEIDGAR